MYLVSKWFDVALGAGSGLYAFYVYQQKYVAPERQLYPLLRRGWDAGKVKDKLAAEAELEREATAELNKLFEGERKASSRK